MLSHYIDLSHVGGPVRYELFGRVLKAAHLSVGEGQPIAVDWPMWCEENGGFGPIMRLLGSQAAISHCLNLLDPLIEAGLLFMRGQVSEVPSLAKCLHGYRRSRKPDRGSPSHLRRLERRALARGEVYQPASVWIHSTHSLPMQSKSTHQRFHIYIERVPAIAVTGELPGSYGFGISLPSF
ncbi:CRISPR-associated protein (Cas_Csy4) [Ectopseudomonas chengduensis]|jgi:hypothetical protein|uniref:CRISPR-associated protein (Cas_Csy4) n=1 Tax=Ectopseudomonas chengduensis TaxID=489632 RepID=A0A1G6Q235_9GAMM|nr:MULTISPECIES: type I-F CRISPR-associated endoribonuclease Cas6/Csy4 [Pseudomonas]MBP3062041.1 type I-F CRISPR-associated endoribonuclease Cas6/Csy4 [Pseudomonas chengduensis]NNB75333.1 type I-F CRISPR-associated endoribonuclease Cas6/Csy4 [Pseudomonas chengduensis]OEO24421.1 hypothetical protein AX279_17280 [Pseudomonas sp. J237]SDC86423.1 CRISPR-associated protein (Cas_Csy4) [Pseudomonas chengduensis]